MEQLLCELQPFMYQGASRSTETVSKTNICGDDEKKTASPQKKSSAGAHENGRITPTQADSLAWCCYILLHGRGAYETLVSMSSSGFANADELNLRRGLVDEIVKDAKKVKSHCNHKMTKVALEEVKSNLLTGVKLKIPELIAFCVYYNKSVMVAFDDKCYMTINSGVDDDLELDATLYYNSRTKKFSYGDAEVVANMEKMVAIEQYTKIVRGFSCYKTAELEEMYKKMGGISNGAATTPTKKEMYEFIYKVLHGSFPQ